MLSISHKKFVKSLKQKKFRDQHNSFVVEGVKMVEELLTTDYKVTHIFATSKWLADHPDIAAVEISKKDLDIISNLKTPNEVVAVVNKKDHPLNDLSAQFTIALDYIQDPGNLGTIIRTADWFGVKNIVCSTDSVDVYNPKVMQATMGSLFRVNVIYTSLEEFFIKNPGLKVYGTLLKGENLYHTKINTPGSVLLMGNESKGIANQLLPFITDKITIPKFGKAESLNVAIATAIFCSESKRNC